MRRARLTLVAAATAFATTLPAAPGHALTAAVFAGTVQFGCFGCGTYGPAGNGLALSVSGVFAGQPVANASLSATFTHISLVGVPWCLVSDSAQGEMGPGQPAAFTWTRAGAVAVLSVPGVGTGVMAFHFTSPVGNPCGGPVTAQVAGGLVGV